MTRRTLWLPIVSSLFIVAGLLTALAADLPVVLQPTDPSFSASDRAAISSGIAEIERILREGYPVPTHRLSGRGWLDRDFVLFVAGILGSNGYETAVVEGSVSGGSRCWVLVGIPLEAGTAWIPIAAAPGEVRTSSRLGKIAWAGSSETALDSAYLSFDRVVELAPNAAPTVSIAVIGYVVAGMDTSLHAHAADRDGTIIAYSWTIEGDDEVYEETDAIFSYAFPETGKYDVTLVVYDNRGALGIATETVNVKGEWNCNCG